MDIRADNLHQYVIMLTLHGSRAYGTATPLSDWDVRGIGIAPLATYLGTRPWEQFQGTSPFVEDCLWKKHPQARTQTKIDCEIFNLTKFVRLAADANPNIFDILFAHPDDWLFASDPWLQLYDHRHLFLSRRVQHTYTGYAMSQLKRIQIHRKWLLEPPQQKPQRSDFALPEHRSLVPKDVQDLAEAMLAKQQQAWQLDQWMEQLPPEDRENWREDLLHYFEMVHGRPLDPNAPHEREQAAIQFGLEASLFQRLEQERRYHQAMHQWKQYETWKTHRNEERALLEQKHGYDCKHAMHLVRLLLSVQEILRTGDLSVRHPQAVLLQEIRQGKWSYDELMAWATEQEQIIQQLASSSKLPKSPDRNQIDALVTEMILQFHQHQ